MDEKEQLRAGIKARALALGFSEVAFVRADELRTGREYLEWISEGRHGEMSYLERYQELRSDPRKMTEGTRSLVVLLTNYNQPEDLLDGGLRITRYAQGDDYHEEIWGRLRQLAAYIHAETGEDVGTRPAVDTAPLLERDLARMAGLGWVGKNALLIRQGLGSYVFISEILVEMDLAPAEVEEAQERCGSCSRCLDACPTGAIISPRVIDARRCISYLTIELRGPIPRRLRPLIGDYLFGCDRCQVVCPWNRKAPLSTDPTHQTREIYRELTPLELLSFDHARYVEVFRRSAMKRAKLVGLKRNAAVVLGNCGRREDVPRLLELLAIEESPLVRGHIVWAIGRLGGWQAGEAMREVLKEEGEPFVLEELEAALDEIEGTFDQER